MNALIQATETNYLGEIEAAFNAGRGAHKFLSGVDSQLMIEWNECGVPLSVVCGAIKSAFERKSPPERAAVNSLAFVKSDVERAFKSWQTAQTGAHAPSELSKADVVAANRTPARDESETVRAELEKLFAQLREFYQSLNPAETECPRLLEVTAQLGKEVKKLLTAKFNHRDYELIEAALVVLDQKLHDCLKAHLTPDENAEIAANAARSLDRFRLRWTKENYNETFEAIFTKAVREHFNAPRLTLFQ